jgi:hypothetical protein
VDHATAYNEICDIRPGEDADYVLVLDADMVITPSLAFEVLDLLHAQSPSVIAAPVLMYWNGRPLRWGSLYPPKPFVFRTGFKYFVPRGHGEMLSSDVQPTLTRNRLIHDDRKPYRAFLESQVRYADALAARVQRGQGSWRDRILRSSPLMMLAEPFASYFVRGGILSGRTGLIYALDRLIVEAIVFRRLLAAEQESVSPPRPLRVPSSETTEAAARRA